MKIIANIICRDSAPELPALLASLKGRVDAIVAIDGESTDKTVELMKTWCRRNKMPLTCKISPWSDDFSAQRNLCLDVTRVAYGIDCSDIWVLMIDTDDVLSEFDRVFIEEAAAKAGITGLMCKMDNGNGHFFVQQFFKLTRDVTWQNPIHEYVKNAGKKGLPPAGKLTIKRGRSARHDIDPERNVRIGRKFVEASPNDSRARFYLARDILECEVLPRHCRFAEAEGHLRSYLAMATNFVEQDRYARLLLARLLSDSGRVDEAREFLLRGIQTDPNNRSGYEALARLSDEKTGKVWQRLAAAADGACVLPYGSKLPEQITTKT